jgi:hypothetical protein
LISPQSIKNIFLPDAKVAIDFIDDIDFNKKLEYWEQFYNFDRPHGSFE